MRRTALTVAVFLAILVPAAHAGERRHGVGVGLDTGTVEFDLPGDPSLDFAGFNIFGKIGVTDRWGIFVNYRDMKDDENLAFGERDSYRQVGAHAAYNWRVATKFRPHAKFGLAWSDHEAELPGEPTLSDSAVGLSVGGGFEAGSQRFAFFLDLELTSVEVELIPGFPMDLFIEDATVGFITKF